MDKFPMEGIAVKELWMLLGEKDVQIFQLLKHIDKLEDMIPPSPPDPPKSKGL